ncbi:dihydroneopterin aldolase [Saccharospirillum salsuginis]|uniref:7,8-dihydroneopterin aldolase n=1 Tax=Saccharospirillum salsuginis TaxID=418750 RepID=A0A918N7U3_9GAMM|nr:dihydroneopterin aldolase [Saccharospirillum salsuginis]GGX45469.1 7,8-dihydroneopterin aldolase [Saccharospirillum salsuginis]
MTDRVFLQELKVETVIGAYDWERSIRQNLWLDLSLAFDCKPAGTTDDLSKALDYDALSRHIRDWAAEQSFELIETFGERLCVLIYEFCGVRDIDLRINKRGAVADCGGVGIHIRRTF